MNFYSKPTDRMNLFKSIPVKFIDQPFVLLSTDDDQGDGPRMSSQDKGSDQVPLPNFEGT